MTRGDLVAHTLALAFQWLTCGPDGRVLALLVRLIRSVRFFFAVAVLSLVVPGVPLGAQIAVTPPDAARIDADTRGALVNRIDTAKRGVGMVVGILTADGRRYLAHGRTAKDGGTEPNQDTVFEIGSITKVFTALLLADMVERGEMRLDGPIAQYLPGVTVPAREGKTITLADLATHTSGLPRLPTNMPMKSPADPYADYGAPLLYQFLSTHTLTRGPGEQWEYSNLGAGLLGHILARHAGVSYEELLRARILQPLGMTSTSVTISEDQRRRLASGHGMFGEPVSLWNANVLEGAYAVRSTAADLLTFAAVSLGLSAHPLRAAMERMFTVSHPAGGPSMRQRIGWMEIADTVRLHDGGTGGYRTAIAIRPGTRQAAVVLSNSAAFEVTDIALHAVVPESGLQTLAATTARTAIELAPEILQTYVGTYRLSPEATIVVTREGTQIFAQATGNPRKEYKAEREGELFDTTNPLATMSFTKDAGGTIVGLVLHLPGLDLPGQRVP